MAAIDDAASKGHPAPGLKPRYDVIVFGGGPAGAAAALALARKGLSVVVLGKPCGSASRIGETVPPEITCVLAQYSLWDRFRTQGHIAAPGIVAMWGSERPHENDFLFDPYGVGWHIDRARFDLMLRDAACEAGAEFCGRAVLSCARSDAGWSALVDAAPDIRTVGRFAIDATGRAAWLARRTGARRERGDRLVALARFGTCSIGETRTLIEAQPDGWWYAAALPDDRTVAVLFTDADLLPRGPRARAQFWERRFAATRLIADLAPVFPPSPLHGFAAASARSLPCAGREWIAIGDAAQSYDPLSGQGIIKALTSALRAADLVAGRRASGDIEEFRDASDREYEHYLALRRAHYRREQRWPEQPFWRRRHQPDRIDVKS